MILPITDAYFIDYSGSSHEKCIVFEATTRKEAEDFKRLKRVADNTCEVISEYDGTTFRVICDVTYVISEYKGQDNDK